MTELEAVRASVAAAMSLTDAQASRLIGDTAEALTADAQALKAEFAIPAAGPTNTAGSDVNAPQGVGDGAARYRLQHGVDENGQPLPGTGQMPRSGWSN